MDTPFDFGAHAGRIVYIRPVSAKDLPKEVQAQAAGHDELHAIHGVDGSILGIAPSRELAFLVARDNKLAPQSVH